MLIKQKESFLKKAAIGTFLVVGVVPGLMGVLLHLLGCSDYIASKMVVIVAAMLLVLRICTMANLSSKIKTAEFYLRVRELHGGELLGDDIHNIVKYASANAADFEGATHEEFANEAQKKNMRKFLEFFGIFDPLKQTITLRVNKCTTVNELYSLRETLKYYKYRDQYMEILDEQTIKKLQGNAPLT